MVHRLRYLTFMCTLISFIVASPFESPAAEYAVRTEKSWLWGWAWGSESTVAVVDRSPVVTFYSRPGITLILSLPICQLILVLVSRVWVRN